MPNMSLETIPKRLPPFRNDSVLSYAIRIKDKSNVIWGRAVKLVSGGSVDPREFVLLLGNQHLGLLILLARSCSFWRSLCVAYAAQGC